MASASSEPRLLAIIELQNAIAAAAMNADEVMHIVAERAASLMAADAAMISLAEGDELVYRSVIRGAAGSMVHTEGERVARAASVAGRCVAERHPVRIDDVSADPLASAERGGAGGSVACVPLLYGETAVGALEVDAARRAAFSEDDVELLRILGQIVAIALHRAYTYPRPRYDSLQDPLTGLGNRRAFDERLDAELSRNRRFGHSFSLALVELTGLEAAIDRLGQPAGDDMLRRVATILKQQTRMIDGCFRVRADGLAIVMPGTSLAGALVVAERCRTQAVDARALDGAVRLAFGVVAATDESADEVTARASAALAHDRA